MKNFLLQIDGLSSENLTSEVLSYILTNDNYSVYQRLFFNYLFSNAENLDSYELEFEVSTQESFPRFGIPDILIKNESEIYIIENKFYAPYSGDNQISRYHNILTNYFSSYKKKGIFLLTIKSRHEYYKQLVANDIKRNITDTNNIEIKYIMWEDILRLFKSNDFIIQNLNNYIKEKYLTNIVFNKYEMEILRNKNTAETLQKLFDFVVRIRELLNSRDYKTGRIGQSYQFYGFSVELENINVWFGYFLTAWLSPINEINTPIYTQIRNDWIKIENIDTTFENKLKELGFIKHPELEWLKPFNIDLINDIELFTIELTNCLAEINKYGTQQKI